jgi:hypothetical protein
MNQRPNCNKPVIPFVKLLGIAIAMAFIQTPATAQDVYLAVYMIIPVDHADRIYKDNPVGSGIASGRKESEKL